MFQKNRDAAERMQLRQREEDEAPRLAAEVPRLRTLRLTVAFARGASRLPESTHIRVVVVSRAPALFRVACADRECRDGGHEITDLVMAALRRGQTRFSGEDLCHGTIGSAESRCSGSMTFEAEASYG
jgi:hypothetical protein